MTALLITVGGTLVTGSVPAAEARDREGWLGVQLQSLTPHLREAMDLDEDAEGALVAGVVPGSPAEAAGFREGDLIVEIDDHEVTGVDQAVDRVRNRDAGDRVLVVVQRDGRRRGLEATLGDRLGADREMAAPRARSRVDKDVRSMLEGLAPKAREDRDGRFGERPGMTPRWKQDDEDRDESFGERGRHVFRWKSDDENDDDDDRDVRVFRFRGGDDDPDGKKGMVFEFDGKGRHKRLHIAPPAIRFGGGRGTYLGVEALRLGDQLAEYFQVPEDGGVLVTRVVEDSPAEEAGIRAGDVIVAVDGKDVEDAGDLRRRVRSHDPGDTVEIEVVRKGSRKTLKATLAKSRDLGGLFTPEGDGPVAGVPEPPLPPDPPSPPDDLDMLKLHLEHLRDLPGLEHLELPDLDIEVRGLDEEHLQELREGLRELRQELRENLHDNLRELHDQLRETHESWREAREAQVRARGHMERARRLERETRSAGTTVM